MDNEARSRAIQAPLVQSPRQREPLSVTLVGLGIQSKALTLSLLGTGDQELTNRQVMQGPPLTAEVLQEPRPTQVDRDIALKLQAKLMR